VSRTRPAAAATASRRFRLPLPAPYDLGWVFGFLADRAAPALERVAPAELVRVVRVDGGAVVLRVRPRGAGLRDPTVRPGRPADLDLQDLPAGRGGSAAEAVRWLDVEATPNGAGCGAAALRRLVRRMLDLDTDLEPFFALARRDPLLARLVARHPGLRLPQLPDPFEGAVRAVIGQQVSVAGARTVIDRLVRQLGEPVPGPLGLFAFPAAAALAAQTPDRIAAVGLTRAKASALVALAAATRDGSVDWEQLRSAPPAAAHAALVALPGIGPWTASYIRMRALGDRDAFPAADLGILKALARRPSGDRPSAAESEAHAERWRPWRAYAAIHLWRSLAA
jgi:AraC family transcriptional regulator, regulatory protein of adaptative response / DNA-3-methyladenine glycosylase II